MHSTMTQASLFDHIETLPPLPGVVDRMLAITDSPRSSATDVAHALCEDPTVAAKILRVANSPFYGSCRKVTQVSRAVVMLGSVAVRNLVIGVCARDALQAAGANTPEHAQFWQHSIAAAAACDLVARRVAYDPPEEVFIGGLLHDIGRLAMITFRPDVVRRVLDARASGIPVLELERQQFGLDHPRAGMRVLTNWRLPEVLCQAVRRHHEDTIRDTGRSEQLLAMVMLGNALTHFAGIGLDAGTPAEPLATLARKALRLSNADVLQILQRLEPRAREATAMLATLDARGGAAARGDTARRALWVGGGAATDQRVGQYLLAQRGYEVQTPAPHELAAQVPCEDLVLIDLPDLAAALALAQRLMNSGWKHVVVLRDPDPAAPSRHRDAATGVAVIPRQFTAFDLRWFEEQA